MANWIIQQYADLGKGINADQKRMDIMPIAYPGDDRAHVWQVTVTKNGEPFNVESGHTVEAYFFREYDGQSPMATGTIVGNVCSVLLPQEAYAYPCRVTGIMRLSTSGSGEITTIGVISFHVGENLTGVIIDPGEAIPSIDNLLAEIHRMEVANQYAETFETRLLNVEKTATGQWFPVMEAGGINVSNGNNYATGNKNRFRSVGKTRYRAGATVTAPDGYLYMLIYYNANQEYTGYSNAWFTGTVNVPECGYFRILARNADISDFTGISNTFISVGEADSMAARMNLYPEIHDGVDSLAGDTWVKFGNATVSGKTATLTGSTGGLRTALFIPKPDTVRVKATLTFNTPTIAAWVYFRYGDSESPSAGYDQIQVEIVSGEPFTFDFDAAYYAEYKAGNGEFAIMFNAPSGSSETYAGTTITVDEFVAYNPAGFRASSYYDDAFPAMMENVFTGIDEAKAVGSGPIILTAPDGSRFKLGVNSSYELVLNPMGVPSNVLFVGNSILLGSNREEDKTTQHSTWPEDKTYAYGLCATSHTKDYYWQVKEAIRAANPNASFSRLFGQPFEILGTSDSFATLWSTTNNDFTGAPMAASFTAALDLIILQLGDNVNDADRVQALSNNIDAFLANVKAAAPNARIIWVDGWFNYARNHGIIAAACTRAGIENLCIKSLAIDANRGVAGQRYETGEGTTRPSSDTSLSHPGDAGMAAIADALIEMLGL